MENQSKTLLVALGAFVLVGVIGLVGYVVYSQRQKSNVASYNQQGSIAQTVPPTNSLNITWLPAPQKLLDLGLFKKKDDQGGELTCGTDYYNIGTMPNGSEIILAAVTECGPGFGPTFYHLLKEKSGRYVLITNGEKYDQVLEILAGNVTIDATTKIDVILPPSKITTKNGVILNTGKASYSNLFSTLESPQKLAETPYGDIYEVHPKDDPNMPSDAKVGKNESEELRTRDLYLKLPDGIAVRYAVNIPFVADDSIPKITFNDNKKNTDTYTQSILRPICGIFGDVTVVNNSVNLTARIEKSGITQTGDPIYRLKNMDDPILKKAYEALVGGNSDPETKVASYKEFVSVNPLFLWQDGFSNYLVFVNAKFTPPAECGKPVIYLYPKTTTEVSVKLDAKISKSEPAYNNGWSVIAHPNGTLVTNDGKTYPSLFWEGQGDGQYPRVDRGKIIRTSQAKEILPKDLAVLGLTQQEANDFLAFWLPRLPKTPYMRVTWFGTREMDQLAPLTVTPTPDTRIRIFLDFEGLQDNNFSLKPQQLGAVARRGFTLVEWGGLLQGK